MSRTYPYVVFDFIDTPSTGAVELEAKLNELGDRGYVLIDKYVPTTNGPYDVMRFIMEHRYVRNRIA